MSLFERVAPARPCIPKSLLQRLASGPSHRERQARAAIELWLEELPQDAQPEMTARLLADDRVFQDAFFELYLYALFRRLNYEPLLHPQVSSEHGRRPDFLMCRGGEPRFYLEATVVHEDPLTVRRCRQFEVAMEAIAQVRSAEFDVGVEKVSLKEEDFPRPKVIRSVQSWLDGLKAEAVDIEDMHHRRKGRPANFDEGDLHLRLWALPRPLLARGITAAVRVRRVGADSFYVACAGSVREALKDKAYHYGDFLLPCLIAINVLEVGCDIEEIQAGAFGRVLVHVAGPDTPQVVGTSRAADGALSNTERSPSRRISGILAEINLDPWSMADEERYSPVLVLNPRARYCFPAGSLPLLRIDDGCGDTSLGGKEFVPARRILGLDRTLAT